MAAVLRHEGELCALRRSARVSDAGLWHCVTGYLEEEVEPEVQARREVLEETGLGTDFVQLERRAQPLRLRGEDGAGWTVTPFLFEVSSRQVVLNWEHDEVQWVDPASLRGLRLVTWLPDVLKAVSVDERFASAWR